MTHAEAVQLEDRLVDREWPRLVGRELTQEFVDEVWKTLVPKLEVDGRIDPGRLKEELASASKMASNYLVLVAYLTGGRVREVGADPAEVAAAVKRAVEEGRVWGR